LPCDDYQDINEDEIEYRENTLEESISNEDNKKNDSNLVKIEEIEKQIKKDLKF
jgi:hypothetical protein